MIKLRIQKVWHVYDLIFVDCVCEITWRRKNTDFFQNMQQQQQKKQNPLARAWLYEVTGLIDWPCGHSFKRLAFPFGRK